MAAKPHNLKDTAGAHSLLQIKQILNFSLVFMAVSLIVKYYYAHNRTLYTIVHTKCDVLHTPKLHNLVFTVCVLLQTI